MTETLKNDALILKSISRSKQKFKTQWHFQLRLLKWTFTVNINSPKILNLHNFWGKKLFKSVAANQRQRNNLGYGETFVSSKFFICYKSLIKSLVASLYFSKEIRFIKSSQLLSRCTFYHF